MSLGDDGRLRIRDGGHHLEVMLVIDQLAQSRAHEGVVVNNE